MLVCPSISIKWPILAVAWCCEFVANFVESTFHALRGNCPQNTPFARCAGDSFGDMMLSWRVGRRDKGPGAPLVGRTNYNADLEILDEAMAPDFVDRSVLPGQG